MSHEHEFVLNPENSNERKVPSLTEKLFNYAKESLAFKESDEMADLRTEMARLDREDNGFTENIKELFSKYYQLAQDVQDETSMIAPIGLGVATASIYKEYGFTLEYRTSMEDMAEYAYGMGYEDIENEIVEKKLEIFREDFLAGLDDLIELLRESPEPLTPDPSSMGFEERTFEELRKSEKSAAEAVLFEKFGVDLDIDKRSVVTHYTTSTDSSTNDSEVVNDDRRIEVTVYKTNMSDEGFYLQELVFADKQKRWVVGPNQQI